MCNTRGPRGPPELIENRLEENNDINSDSNKSDIQDHHLAIQMTDQSFSIAQYINNSRSRQLTLRKTVHMHNLHSVHPYTLRNI